jgi:hypothetical protein
MTNSDFSPLKNISKPTVLVNNVQQLNVINSTFIESTSIISGRLIIHIIADNSK